MTDIPFIILAFIYALSFALMGLAYIYRTSFPMSFIWFMIGSLSLIIFFTTDNIALGFVITDTSQIMESTIGNNTVYHMVVESSTTDSQTGNFAGQAYARGEEVSINSQLIGDKIQCIDLLLAKVGSPPASTLVRVGVYIVGNNQLIQQYGSMNVTDLTTTLTWYDFCVEEGLERQGEVGLVYGFDYLAGSAGNYVLTRHDITNPFDGTMTQRGAIPFGNTVWSLTSSNDHTMRLYDFIPIVATTEDFIQEEQVYAIRNPTTLEPTLIGLIFIFLSLSFIMVGILIEKFS